MAKPKKEETLELRWLRVHGSDMGFHHPAGITYGPAHFLVLQYNQAGEWKDVPIAFE